MKPKVDYSDCPPELGVVLMWVDYPRFGRYGYIVRRQRESHRDLPIPFTQANLIDRNEPLVEGCLVNYTLHDDDDHILGRMIPVNVEVERFTTHNSQLDFTNLDLWTFPVLDPEDLLGNYLLTGLSAEQRQLLEQYQKEDWPEVPSELIDYLNTVVARPLLFEKERFANVKFRRLTTLLIEKRPRNHELTWLNRLLLEDAFPESLMQKPFEIDCSGTIYEGIVDAIDHGKRHGSLKLLNGESRIFSFDAFPADEVVPQTGDQVRFRVVDDNKAYDIWPLSQSKQTGEMESGSERFRAVANDTTAKLNAVTNELRAAAEQLKEVSAPFREMYKDERYSKVKADALRAKVPESVVDIIIAESQIARFPTVDALHARLRESGILKQLESKHGISRPTVGRWLATVRKIMVSRGLAQKYRHRSTESPKQISPAKPEHSRSPKAERRRETPDTRSQELPEGADEIADSAE